PNVGYADSSIKSAYAVEATKIIKIIISPMINILLAKLIFMSKHSVKTPRRGVSITSEWKRGCPYQVAQFVL
ncbi:MAG: hypothetical protein ACERKY_09490, partial [Anaerolineales bacterium]